MAYWLLKTEPDDYGYHHLEEKGLDVWDGVRNFKARKNIKAMRPGDMAFIYHTGKEKSIVGVAEVTSRPYPGQGPDSPHVIDVAPGYRLSRPVTLAEIKRDPAFSEWDLVRLPRLSVMPVSREHWLRIHGMAGSPEKEDSI